MEYLADTAILYLHELDGTGQGGGIWRWANSAEPDGRPVRWRGVEWPPLDVKVEGYQWGGDVIPRPRVTASLADENGKLPRFFLDLLATSNGGLGMTLSTWRVAACCLEGHEAEGTDAVALPDLYIIDRASWNALAVSWEFIALLDLPRCTLPARYALHDTCPFVYRRWNADKKAFEYGKGTGACPYTGQACFNRHGKTCNPEEDECGRRLADCLARHGSAAPLPFGGFPGLGGK